VEKNVTQFAGVSDMVAQSIEQTRKTMENCLDLFRKSMTASPWVASSNLNKKMQSYTEQNIAAASDFAKKLTQAKDFGDFWSIQTDFMQAQWKAFSQQMNDLSDTATKSSMSTPKDISS
jgi:hypothetical protein